ncbi:MAG: 1,4-alpha-glucan branching protein GlgB [Bacteroidota bacterium]
MSGTVAPFTLFSEYDIHLFQEGKHFKLYEKLGSHVVKNGNKSGTYFAVWAPSAKKVSVIGDFNSWNKDSHVLKVRWDSSGVWEGFIPDIGEGSIYKYLVLSESGEELEKGDPYARHWEIPPKTGSIVWNKKHRWRDKDWMTSKQEVANSHQSPISVYEVHLASWKRRVEEGNRSLTYRELSVELINYVKEMGFTHIEFMPVMEHPFGGSWGYQLHGYFAPTSRFGSPVDFSYLVDKLHQAGIGVILDWVPSHFPGDDHGLYQYDGTALYEHEDPRLGFHPDWNSYIFNYGRKEIRSFLISNAMFWLDRYHIDGLRVDAVASMLYLDYSRKEGEWVPNKYGGRENLDAISFLKDLNEAVYGDFPNIMMAAEESTSFPNVSRPTYQDGLGFGYKWMMGWMNDTLEYFKKNTYFRKYHHNEISFSLTYAFAENFMLPLSHDEVVHGKGPLIGRMPGDEWQRFANLRLLYGYMFTHPGSKLLFMGSEFGQTSEWDHDSSLDWHLLQYPIHNGVLQLIKDLNKVYRDEPALHELAYEGSGFEWIDYSDHDQSVLAYIRKGFEEEDKVIVVCNFTPLSHEKYRIGVPEGGSWKEILNTDNMKYSGSGFINTYEIKTDNTGHHNQPYSLCVKLPPLGVCILKRTKE